MVLMAKSHIGQICTRLFLDWMEGKISKEEFQYRVKGIERQLQDNQLELQFEIKGVDKDGNRERNYWELKKSS